GGNGASGAAGVAIYNGKIYLTSQDHGLLVLNTFQPVPELSSAVRMENSTFHLSWRAEVDQAVRIQRSSDLMLWEDWRTVTGTGTFQPLTDEGAGGTPMQFYRAAT